jgi:hypothetical protein
MDGEAAYQIFFTLNAPTAVQPTLLLPNSNLFDCCKDFDTLVLATDGIDNMQNDVTSFLNMCSPTASGAVYKLYKNDVLVATLSGTTYGIDYTFGFSQLGLQKYVGYKIEWYKVLALFGSGIYKVELVVTDAMLGNSNTFSNEYKLCEYRADRADQTIRLDWWQNGTLGNQFSQQLTMNYNKLNWHNQIRLGGFFGYPKTEGETEYVRYWNGLEEWVTDEKEPIYQLKTKRIPANLQKLIMVDIMSSDRCSITDYNSKNAETWVDFEIKFKPTHQPNWKPLQTKLSDVELQCTQRYNNYKKHR